MCKTAVVNHTVDFVTDHLSMEVDFLKEMHAMERVCVFIDNSNLFHMMRLMYGKETRLDFLKLKEFLAAGQQANCRFYYSFPVNPESLPEPYRQSHKQSVLFYEYLASIGFHLTSLPLRERMVNDALLPTEKGLDCEIVYDMAVISRTGTYKRFVLVAGDEDYARTIKRIRSETGIEVDVAFFGGSYISTMLVREASRFYDLGQVHDIFKEPKQKQSRKLEMTMASR
jgi:uncharacterized LabA/DUF88 family protein